MLLLIGRRRRDSSSTGGSNVSRLDEKGLVREGWVDEQRLWELLAGVDVSVNLRHPTMGETSGIAIRSLSLGKPLVVSDVGWFSELPDGAALKVPVDEHEVDTLAAALELLVAREDVREQMGRAAAARQGAVTISAHRRALRRRSRGGPRWREGRRRGATRGR